MTNTTKKSIVAVFQPQAWQNNYAINVDNEGENEWDVTEYILSLSKEKALEIKDDQYESDDLREIITTPKWIREWDGPFYIKVENSIQEYFEKIK